MNKSIFSHVLPFLTSQIIQHIVKLARIIDDIILSLNSVERKTLRMVFVAGVDVMILLKIHYQSFNCSTIPREAELYFYGIRFVVEFIYNLQ